MGRKSACGYSNCGFREFGRAIGIPTCKVLTTSDQLAKWTRYEDLTRSARKLLLNQQVEREGKICNFCTEFKKYSKRYRVHHAKAK